ncbi:MAG: hypothetical protein JEY94_04285 [Melioribacteraceae bacterium]|nr:hypothetical protein [Melioribacteraceae bacterium]
MFKQKAIQYSDQFFELTKEGLISFTKLFMRKAFDVREGEITRVLLMQLNIFLLISTILILKPAVNSLFLSKFGANNLPYAFLLVSLFVAAVSFIYSRVLKVTRLNKIIITTIIFSIFMFFLFWVLLSLNFLEGWVLYLFYIWVSIFAVLSASQFWIMANVVFSSREAKRLFGFIGAGAIAGGIFGGYLASVLAYIINSENLLLVCIFLLSLCIPITKRIWKIGVADVQTTFEQKKRFNGFADHPIQLIRNSKHLTYLASIICVSVIVAKLVDYQFAAIASREITDPDSLTAFFGFWLSTISIASLFIQLFITRKVVGVFGVGISLFFLPVGILLGVVALFFVPELWAAIFLKTNEGSLKQSVNKAGIELLALPIPHEIKNQTKSFIDVVIDSMATGFGGFILLVFVVELGLSTSFVSFLIMLHLILWFYLVVKIRKEYVRLFKLKVNQIHPESKKMNLDLTNESVIGGLIKVLEKGSERQILFTLGKIKRFQNERFFIPLFNLLNHSSAEVRLETLQNLYVYKNKNINSDVAELINDTSQEVKIAAFQYLIRHTTLNLSELIKPYLTSDNYGVREAVILALAIESRGNHSLKNEFRIEAILKDLSEEIKLTEDCEKAFQLKINYLKAISCSGFSSLYADINNSFTDNNPKIVKQAILSAGSTLDPQFIDKIIDFILNDEYKESVKTTLLNYGSSIIDELFKKIKDKNVHIEKRILLISVIEKVGVQKSVNYLFGLIGSEELNVRNEAIKALNNLKKNFPVLKFNKRHIVKNISEEANLYYDTIVALYSQINANQTKKNLETKNQKEARESLIKLLEKRLDGNLERIFHLLGLRYPHDDIVNIYKGIKSNKPDLRTNAIEFLDNILDPYLKRVLIPIIETAALDSISEVAIKNLKIKVPSEYECVEILLHGKDLKIKLAVLYFISQWKDPRYKVMVESLINSDDHKIKSSAINVLEEMEKG